MKVLLIAIDVVVCLILLAVVTLQSGKTAGLSGAIGGGSDTYLAKTRSKSLDSRLSRATKWIAGAFILLTLVLNLI
ncbi:MAG: preprotein translocase subunit SecG [Oscillospiraceae bacterium]|jgi:preprotein translocase subunit SecG|nr:preprotein translocase subunit SecG [Oscillospiraceae bacterium]